MNTPFTPDVAQSALPAVIGVVASQLLNPHQQTMLERVTRQLNARGVITLLLSAETDAELAVLFRQAAPLALRGVLVLPGNTLPLAALSDTCDIPVLQVDAEPEMQADALRAGQATAGLLIAQGHQRFGFMQSQPGSPAQKQGFSASLLAAGLTINRELVAGGRDRDAAYRVMTGYLKTTRAAERIHALYCESDLLAFGALQAIRDFGQGTHLAVVGMGDVDEARSSTWHLTSWSSPAGQIMEQQLDRLLGQQAVNNSDRVKGELRLRHSHYGKVVPGEMSACGCAFRH